MEIDMTKKSNRFAGPFLLSICSLALIVPTAAVARDKNVPSKDAKSSLAMKLSSAWDKDKRDRPGRRDGRPKDGPRDTGFGPGGNDPRPTSP
jgi:hypothetical protein